MSTNVGSVTNFFPTAQNGFTTTLASTISSGAATVPLNSVTGYTNGDTIVFIVDPTDPTKKQAFTGVVDTAGVQITGVVWTSGTNQTHTTGATVVDYVTATHLDMITKGLLVSHNSTGTIKNNAITSAAQITDGIVGDAEMATAVKPVTLFNENTFDHVVSGLVITADSVGVNKNYSITSGVVMINGKRLTVAAVSAVTVTASKDRYIDATDNSDGTAILSTTAGEVNNNVASPAIAANSIRIGIVVAGATTIATTASINQGQEDRVLPIASSIAYSVTDSLGNLICPRDPNRKILGYRQIITNATATTIAAATGLSCPIIVPTGRKIKITVFSRDMFATSLGTFHAQIWDGVVNSGTQLTQMLVNSTGTSTSLSVPATMEVITTPSTASKTYNVGLAASAGTVNMEAGATSPAFIKVELA